MRALGPGWWLLVLAATTLSDLIDLAVIAPPGATALVRMVLLTCTGCAVLRRLGGIAAPGRPSRALARYALFETGMALLFGISSHLLFVVGGLGDRPLATTWLVTFLVAAAWSIATIRLTGISAALACGAPFAAMRGAVAKTKGHATALAACVAQIVLPFTAIHLALVLLATSLPLPPKAIAALALLDGVVSAIAVLLALALLDAAWRIDARRFP
ncbi:hypothetical protein [Sphingomonas jatrophae]|uniref:Uncharacterized protein n=1 Tax=Sphingomonas jatrophae TaxID=1166337 RepID=A0A1I6LLF6_9SPHN|nr:hypothetical protein [Sphingomonas jatrophae]SFS04229.1 hypothetical protein SAMN05192580_2900 [Sphingomonas jatrophae]